MTTTTPRTSAGSTAIVSRTFRAIQGLAGGYVGLSWATLVAAALLRHHPAEVNAAVWIRGSIVAVTSLLTLSFAVRAARGSRRALLRLRIISAVLIAVIAAIIAVPGPFPLWLKIEQGACGLLLIGIAVLASRRELRSQRRWSE